MSLFDSPHPAHFGDEPILWFGTEVLDNEIMAIVANGTGRLLFFPVASITADVRFVDDLDAYPDLGRKGPGWIELEDMVTTIEPVGPDAADIKQRTVREILSTEPAEGSKDYVTDSEGNKYDPVSGQPLD